MYIFNMNESKITVRELIEKLQKIKNQDRIVVLSRDEEGNGFSYLADIGDNIMYNEQNSEIGLEELTKKLQKQGYSEEDVMEDGIPAIVLWP